MKRFWFKSCILSSVILIGLTTLVGFTTSNSSVSEEWFNILIFITSLAGSWWLICSLGLIAKGEASIKQGLLLCALSIIINRLGIDKDRDRALMFSVLMFYLGICCIISAIVGKIEERKKKKKEEIERENSSYQRYNDTVRPSNTHSNNILNPDWNLHSDWNFPKFDADLYIRENCSESYKTGFTPYEDIEKVKNDPNLTSAEQEAVESRLRSLAMYWYD